MLEPVEGPTIAIRYRGGALAEYPEPIEIHDFPSGQTISVDRIYSLVVPGRRSGQFDFVRPGQYEARVEVAFLRGETLTSNEFTLRIAEATGVDRQARDRIQFVHVAFLEGRDSGLDPSNFDGREFAGRVNVSRFGELQKIMEGFPDSTYARWIRFWKLYHHGPIEDAIGFARNNVDFPLADNLMLHLADAQFNARNFARSRELLRELSERWPDGDTRTPARRLEEKLDRKP